MPELLPGAEPFSADGGPHGVLVCHGYTGNPQSMRPLAEAFAAAGFAVELPVWPGHGTSVDDLLGCTWDDWSNAAEVAFLELAGRCDRVVVAGLSMGGTLACWLATRHPEIAGVVAVNPLIEPAAPVFREMLAETVAQGIETIPAIGSDIAKPGVVEVTYDATPIRPLLSLFEATDALVGDLAELRSPVLLFTSPQDHVVPPVSSDLLASTVAGPVERVTLPRSYHVATLDFDADEICARAVDFARKVTAG